MKFSKLMMLSLFAGISMTGFVQAALTSGQATGIQKILKQYQGNSNAKGECENQISQQYPLLRCTQMEPYLNALCRVTTQQGLVPTIPEIIAETGITKQYNLLTPAERKLYKDYLAAQNVMNTDWRS